VSRLTDRVERDLREVAAGAHPSPSAWQSIVARLDDDAESGVALTLAPVPDGLKHRAWLAVAAAVLVVIAGSIAVLTSVRDDRSISPTEVHLTATFISPRNGFSVGYLDRGAGTVTPSRQRLGWSDRADEGFDVIETESAVFRGASTELPSSTDGNNWVVLPPGVSVEEWVDEFLSNRYGDVLPNGCGEPRDEQAEITIDGESGRIAACPNRIEATVVAGGRLYVFTLTHDRRDARSVFDAFVATIDLTPETAVGSPAMATTFVSPTYGYSFDYLDRGGLAPATDLWDPDSQPARPPLDARLGFDPRLDAVETGYPGGSFQAASTPMPGGVSIDGWVDEYVTPLAAGGCGVPRGQQAEITIDGHSGRVAECGHTEATVVAGGRLYLFIGPGESRRAREWFDAWIATIDLTPETAT
jgi:hypothetical protein